jgi:formate hydrogenlyase subunit 4
MIGRLGFEHWVANAPVMALLFASLAAVALVECCRVPIDDPNTHLELTMIHEVLVLDHGGPDLGLILYGSTLKLWLLGALAIGVLLPFPLGAGWAGLATDLAGIVGLAAGIGVVESTMARLPLPQVPRYLVFAGSTALLALMLEL